MSLSQEPGEGSWDKTGLPFSSVGCRIGKIPSGKSSGECFQVVMLLLDHGHKRLK
jgi:hypothetical protein